MYNCGIYQIRNIINNKIYIGQSIDLKLRKKMHFSNLRNNSHGNKHLQNSWNKYGSENFIFEILLYCENFELTYYEQEYVNRKLNIYNICVEIVNSPKGRKLSEEAKKKISIAHTGQSGSCSPLFGRILSEEHKQKLSDSHSGSCNYWIGRNHSEETLLKFSIANSGSCNPHFGVTGSMSANFGMTGSMSALFGRKMSDETKEKIGKANSNISDETRQKMSNARKKYWEKKKFCFD